MVDMAWFMYKQRVRYPETDQMGVVYHANYLNWFELGRTEFIRELGIPYKSIEQKGLLLPVTDAELHFKQPAYYDDIVQIYVRVLKCSNVRLEFEVQIRRNLDDNGNLSERGILQVGEPLQGELLVSGMTKHVWLNKAWKLVRLDHHYPELYSLLQNL